MCVCSHSHLVYTHTNTGEQFSLRVSEIQHRSQVILITHTVVPLCLDLCLAFYFTAFVSNMYCNLQYINHKIHDSFNWYYAIKFV